MNKIKEIENHRVYYVKREHGVKQVIQLLINIKWLLIILKWPITNSKW